MPKVKNLTAARYPVVVFEEVLVTDVAVSAKDAENPEPAYFYVDALVNGEETQFTVSGLPAVEFQKWCNLPPVPVKIQAELHIGQFTGKDGTRVSVRLHAPQIGGLADSVQHLLNGNGKKPAVGG